MGKSSRDKRDIFYRLAKEQGWRARSAYKLLQIDDEFNILANDHNGNPLTRVVDLCAAPGSWSQVLSKRIWEPRSESDRQDVKIVAVDLQAMAPIPGIIQLQGDITSRETADRVIQQFEGKKAQLVVCDGAPDVTGLHDLDEYIQSHLVLAALTICARILENGGTFLAKVFRGREAGLLGAQLRCLFAGDVVFAKPSSSRNSSLESFVVCRNFRGDSILPPSLVSTESVESISNDNSVDSLMGWLNGLDQLNREQRIILPFVACGDLSGYDADSCYELGDDYTPHEPVQPPISAAYLDVCRKARSAAVNVASSETPVNPNHQTEENKTLSRLMEAAHISDPAATESEEKSKQETEKAELEALMPTLHERRWLHNIALFYFLVGVVIGLPLWWYTTSPEQHALPTEKIAALASQAITVGVDVVVLNLNPKLPKEDIDSLKQSLYFNAADAQRSLDAQHQVIAAASGRYLETRRYAGLPVRVDYRFYVSDASRLLSKDILAKGVSSDLDHALINSDLFVHLGGDKSSAVRHNVEGAYYFVILPSGLKGLEQESINLDAIVRANTERNIIYLRSLPTGKMNSVILGILQDQLVKPPTLQAIYSSVWWKGSDTEVPTPSSFSKNTLVDYASARAEVAKLRTHQLPAAPGYEVTVTLVSPFDAEPPSPHCLSSTDDWLWGHGNVSNLSFGEWLQRYVIPGLGDLKKFLNLNIYSQYLYSVTLEALEWSKLSKDRTHRYYSSAQLSNVLNSLEAYLGQHTSERSLSNDTNGTHGGLHLIVVVDTPTREYNATERKPLRFHISGSSRADPPSSIALVPQWGAFISLDDVNVGLGNLGGVLVNIIKSFVGLSVRRQDVVNVGNGGSQILMERCSTNEAIVKWELDLWLRRRTIESLSTAALTLTSLVSTLESVPTMVINLETADRVKSSVSAWSEAISELASPPSTPSKNPEAKAFVAARTALENADAAFFDHSLLDLLYFPSDQVFGIYVPLFAPIGLPLIASGIAALKFFLMKAPK